MEVLLIGTGNMATEYAKVLTDLNVAFDVVGRSASNCNKFKEVFPEANVFGGGLENFMPPKKYTHAIVSSNVDYLSDHTKKLIEFSIENVLVEKPGGKDLQEIENLSKFAVKNNSKVIVAYNRRFYSSVLKCKELIEEDGGVKSFNFEFTEWPHTMENIPNYEVVKNNLLFANSTHVIDLAFYLGGFPAQMKSFSTDNLAWHKKAIFSGAGISNAGALFSYHANWKGPGRWVIEIITEKHRFLFKPMEQLQIQLLNSVKVDPVAIDNKFDVAFKPGLYLQTKTFLLEPDNKQLLSIVKQAENCKKYQQILDGN